MHYLGSSPIAMLWSVSVVTWPATLADHSCINCTISAASSTWSPVSLFLYIKSFRKTGTCGVERIENCCSMCLCDYCDGDELRFLSRLHPFFSRRMHCLLVDPSYFAELRLLVICLTFSIYLCADSNWVVTYDNYLLDDILFLRVKVCSNLLSDEYFFAVYFLSIKEEFNISSQLKVGRRRFNLLVFNKK